MEESETGSLPNRLSKDKTLFNKKTLQNSSEQALFRRSPTAYFGLAKSQEIELFAAQAVDPDLGAEAREAQATREMKRKLNPFLREETDERGASATRKTEKEGVMPPERTRDLTLAKPLSLDQFVAIMMPHLGVSRSPNFNKNNCRSSDMSSNSDSSLGVSRSPDFNQTDSYSTNVSSKSDPDKLHATLHGRLIHSASISTFVSPFDGTVTPGKSGEDLF